MNRYMSMSSDTKVVQTRLDRSEYERLQDVADQEDKPLKEVLREAVLAYTDAHVRPDPDDPLFTVDPPAGDGDDLSASDTDDYLYGDGAE